jgi:hypothetical protein
MVFAVNRDVISMVQDGLSRVFPFLKVVAVDEGCNLQNGRGRRDKTMRAVRLQGGGTTALGCDIVPDVCVRNEVHVI